MFPKYPGTVAPSQNDWKIVDPDRSTKIKINFLLLEYLWAKIWQKVPSDSKSQKWDIYRERKAKILWTITENLKRLFLQIAKIWAFNINMTLLQSRYEQYFKNVLYFCKFDVYAIA